MTIVLIIAIVATVACMVMLTYRINTTDKKIDTAISMMDRCTGIVKDVNGYTTRSVKTANGNFTSIASALKNHGDEIAEITGRLDSIVADIERLDNDVAQVRRKEREIRSYYVNFREPKALPVYGTGVPWAKDFPCNDEHE